MAIKKQSETLTYTYDFGPLIGTAEITSFVATTDDAGIVKDGEAFTETAVLVRWSGGTPGESYVTRVLATLDSGDVIEIPGTISVTSDTVENIYGSVSGFRSYHLARGIDIGSYTDAKIAAQLLNATEWIDATFRNDFQGWKLEPFTQEREWPRTGVVDYYGYAVLSTVVPVQIERATYEAAFRMLQNANAFNPVVTGNKYKRVSIDGALSVEYANQTIESMREQVPIIGQVLSALLESRGRDSSGLSSRAVRG